MGHMATVLVGCRGAVLGWRMGPLVDGHRGTVLGGRSGAVLVIVGAKEQPMTFSLTRAVEAVVNFCMCSDNSSILSRYNMARAHGRCARRMGAVLGRLGTMLDGYRGTVLGGHMSAVLVMHEKWVGRYGRVEKDTEEKNRRFKIFEENVKHIESFNRANDKPYKLSINKFADLTNEEFTSLKN
ncbi:hypothetical protein RJ639_032377 [Escallonia herrerae]|uniref:Cathepsin propeptide inhibitor domain-containing protein n=1 Tax=Escallonia herrerae TaxID=1293975 RepID=A0AA89B851_9ASTE|nr:hypothetical protein RJ639_032377 [Escallonia herrerae]